MTPNAVKAEIQSFVADLISIKLAVRAMPVTIFAKKNNRIVSYSTLNTETVSSSKISEYLSILETENFLCLLNDGALIQISYSFLRSNLINHRLCYYPCPIDVEINADDPNDPLISIKDKINAQISANDLGMKSPIRFDYSIEKTRIKIHSISHFHLNFSHTRIPVFGPLSVGHFGRFVCKYFYPKYWIEYLKNESVGLKHLQRTVLAEEEKDIYFNVRTT